MQMFNGVKKILIFKLCCLGDTVFMTPAIKSLRKNFPDAKIVYAYEDWIEPMMQYIPEIDDSILFENVYSENILKKIAGTLKFIFKIRREKFDMVLYGHRSNLLSFVLKLTGIRYRLGYRGTKFLTHTGVFNKYVPEFHRYLSILSENGLLADEKIPELKKAHIEQVCNELSILPGTSVVGIFPFGGNNPGTKMNIKRWSLKNYFLLAEMINKELPEIKIIFFEGDKDEELTIPMEIKAIKRSISVELISCCGYFMSADTGSLHIAAALKVPTLSIFGPSDPRLVAPGNYYGIPDIHRTIWKKPYCSPCYTPDTAIDTSNNKYWREGEFICHTGTHICIRSITVSEVFLEFSSLLNAVEEHHQDPT